MRQEQENWVTVFLFSWLSLIRCCDHDHELLLIELKSKCSEELGNLYIDQSDRSDLTHLNNVTQFSFSCRMISTPISLLTYSLWGGGVWEGCPLPNGVGVWGGAVCSANLPVLFLVFTHGQIFGFFAPQGDTLDRLWWNLAAKFCKQKCGTHGLILP